MFPTTASKHWRPHARFKLFLAAILKHNDESNAICARRWPNKTAQDFNKSNKEWNQYHVLHATLQWKKFLQAHITFNLWNLCCNTTSVFSCLQGRDIFRLLHHEYSLYNITKKKGEWFSPSTFPYLCCSFFFWFFIFFFLLLLFVRPNWHFELRYARILNTKIKVISNSNNRNIQSHSKIEESHFPKETIRAWC